MPPFARLAVLGVIWGSSFLFIKVALEGMSPGQVVLGRLVGGTAALALILAARGARLPTDRSTWRHLFVTGLVANVVPFFLFAWGEERVPSATAGVLNATTPLFTTVAVLVALPQERPTRQKLLGLVTGFVGVLIVIGTPTGGGLLGQVACVAAAACYGITFAYTKRFLTSTGLSPLVLSVSQLGCATVIMLLLTPIAATQPTNLRLAPVLSVLALGVVGTGLAYLLYHGLIRDIGATGASMVTYLVPLSAVALGVVVLGERLGWNLFVGGAVVILGVALAEGRLSRPEPYEGAPSAAAEPGRRGA